MIPAEGEPIATVGAMVSTVNAALADEAGARLPALSLAVPPAIEIPRVPFPAMLEIVTVWLVPLPATFTTPSAVPVLVNVTWLDVNALVLKLASA